MEFTCQKDRDGNYIYKGVQIPEYDLLKANDTIQVQEAKLIAQQRIIEDYIRKSEKI